MPCQPGRFRPHASYLRKEARCRASAKKLPKGTPWKGFLWTPPETEGPRSLWHPGAARYRDFPSRALLRTFERSIVGSTTNLEDPTWRKANFLWKFLCAGGASLDYGGDPIPTAVPPQGFLQNKNALRRRRLPNLLLGSLIVVRTANRFAIADQSESAGKNRRSLPQWLDTSCLEPMGSHKGPQTLVYLRASVKPAGRSLPEPPLAPGPQVQPKAPRCRQAAKTKTLFPFGKISGII